MGCGKKEQADTASPTPATHLTSPERPQASSGQGDRFQKFLRPEEGEKYLSPEEVERKKATPEGRNMLKSQILSGEYVTRPMLLKRGVRHLQRTKRTRDRAKRAMTRKARRQIRGGGTRRYRRRRGGKRRRTRHRPAKRRARTKRQHRRKHGSRIRRR